ncbi:hypothetical protein CEXT_498331 [Caerostris extrusa]|uniref:Secreted protein n=1 Tax=Caerostris extrusa TaxID=172846 RepID=A0AAV4P332_CAEEX|nr:hypothetical protein CEXT_498331 [Caerostris extrusa]
MLHRARLWSLLDCAAMGTNPANLCKKMFLIKMSITRSVPHRICAYKRCEARTLHFAAHKPDVYPVVSSSYYQPAAMTASVCEIKYFCDISENFPLPLSTGIS